MQNVEVADIVGFDPVSGERIEDKSDLQPLEDHGKYSWKVRQRFIAAIDAVKSITGFLYWRANPNELFFAGRQAKRGTYDRRYYRQPGDEMYASMEFGIDGRGNVTGAAIELKGEKHHSDLFSDWEEKEKIHVLLSPSGCLINATLGPSNLGVAYNTTGDLRSVSFDDALNEEESLLLYWDSSIQDTLATGSALFPRGVSQYKVDYNVGKGEIIVTRTRNGKEVKDEMVIPVSINRQALLDSIFPDQLSNDPVEAGSEADDEWKLVNLGTFGITWNSRGYLQIPQPAE